MSLISRSIAQLFGGVSQQPAQLRSDSQCESMENCWPDVAVGLSKRPPSQHIARLNTDNATAKTAHFINRDASEKYVVVIKDEEIKVYDLLTGTEKTVTTPDGVTYLDTTSPKDDLAFLTVADTTFIVNRSKTVTMDAAASYTAHVEYFVNVVSAVADAEYTVRLDGTEYTVTAGSGTSWNRTNAVASQLVTTINAGGTFTATLYETESNLFKIVKTAGGSFAAEVSDSRGDTALVGFRDSIESSSQLPVDFWADFVIKVTGALEDGADDMYVKYDTTEKRWKETVKGGLQNNLTSSTMPHKLVRNADGTFTFSKITWDPRETGDLDSNPPPSLVGQKINNIFFYRERLGLLSGENIVMSKATEYYDFFRSTVSGVLDDDPIDVTVADTRVSQLYHAVPFQDSLLVFADTGQYQLSGGDILSPKTARLDATTRFNTSKVVPPVAAGRDVYFTVDRGNYSSMREYFVLPDGINSDAADVTAHVPKYVPKNLGGIASSTLLDAVFMYSRDYPSDIYVYKYLWSGDQKVQSAWGKMSLPTDVTLLGFEVMDTVLYMAIRRSDGTYIEKIDFQAGGTETGMSFLVYLDRRYSLTGVYNSTTKETTWTLPYADSADYEVVLGSGFGTKAGTKLQVTKGSTTTVISSGDWSASACFVGKPYTMRYRFSEQFVRDDNKVALLDGKLVLRTVQVSFSDSCYFKAEVTPNLRDKNTYVYTGIKLGTSSATIGAITPADDSYRFPVITSSRGVTIDLVNDSPLPSTFQSAAWEAEFTKRARRLA